MTPLCGHRLRAQREERRVRSRLQSRRRDRARTIRLLPQQRHGRARRLARTSGHHRRRRSEDRRRRRQTALSGRPAAGSRKHPLARCDRLERRPCRESRRSAIQLSARSRLRFGGGTARSARAVRATGRLLGSLPAGLLRRCRPLFRRALAGLSRRLPAARRGRALRRRHVGRRALRRQAIPRDQPAEVSREVGDANSARGWKTITRTSRRPGGAERRARRC